MGGLARIVSRKIIDSAHWVLSFLGGLRGTAKASLPGAGADKTPPQADSGPLPAHVAIIMDGNGRWAQRRSLPRSLGHREGAETLKRIARYLKRLGVRYLTVFAFSTENWVRPKEEVNSIIGLMRNYISAFDRDPENDQIRVRFIGDIEALEPSIQKSFRDISEKTRGNEDALVLTIAFNYGGRSQIARAARDAAKLATAGLIKPEDINEELFASLLDVDCLPDPDLLIRTGAETRVSNFLLWEIAYAELWFTDVLWPDFTEKDIDVALSSFRRRRRKYGGVTDAHAGS